MLLLCGGEGVWGRSDGGVVQVVLLLWWTSYEHTQEVHAGTYVATVLKVNAACIVLDVVINTTFDVERSGRNAVAVVRGKQQPLITATAID